MDLGRAYTFAFDDPEWASKFGLGALVSMVPGLNLVGLGYEVQVARGDARPFHPGTSWRGWSFAIWLISGHLTGQLLQADAARATALEPLLPGA